MIRFLTEHVIVYGICDMHPYLRGPRLNCSHLRSKKIQLLVLRIDSIEQWTFANDDHQLRLVTPVKLVVERVSLLVALGRQVLGELCVIVEVRNTGACMEKGTFRNLE